MVGFQMLKADGCPCFTCKPLRTAGNGASRPRMKRCIYEGSLEKFQKISSQFFQTVDDYMAFPIHRICNHQDIPTPPPSPSENSVNKGVLADF